jgi:sulfatase maturation enzyme AslB (radical SAM superfamily)
LQFFNENKFSMEFSFDGLAQEIHRDRGNFKRLLFNIESLLNLPDVYLEVNSVFTPESVPFLSESIKFIMELGVSNINVSISLIEPWGKSSLTKLKQEMQKLREILLIYYKKMNEIPVLEFRENPAKGFFYCAAGQDRLAITPKGQIWGCDLFAAFFKGKENSPEYRKYFFGDLQTFVKKHKKIFPRIFSNYSKLSMDNFSTPSRKCLFCMELEKCKICPVSASFSGNPIGKIPSYACKIQEIRIHEREKFRKEIRTLA